MQGARRRGAGTVPIDIDAPALLMLQDDDNPEFSLHRLMRMGIRKAFDALMLLSGFAEVAFDHAK
jgi:hypothetical protein